MTDIFNAYRDYIKTKPNIRHDDELKILHSDKEFKKFSSALLETVEDKTTANNIGKLLERQRNILITENVGGKTPMVTNFPLLVDTFANLSAIKAAVWYPTNSPIVSMPRLELHGEVLTQNDEVKTFVLNNAKQRVRGDGTYLDLTPDATPKIYENLLSLHIAGGGIGNLETLSINRQYTGINKITVNDAGLEPAGTFETTITPIVITSDTVGIIRNNDTVQIVINAPAANPTDTILLDVTGDIDGVIITITPNDGTNNGATAVDITSLALVEAITAGVTGTYDSINVVITDTNVLLLDLISTGGDSELLIDGHAIDGDEITLVGGIDTGDIDITISILPDARNHWNKDIIFTDKNGISQTFNIYGNINLATSDVVCYFANIPARISITNVRFYFFLSPKTSSINRVKFDLDLKSKDAIIDPDDNFELTLALEVIQDYTIFDIDVLEIISDVLKQQLSINDSHDVGSALTSMNYDINNQGGNFTFDYSNFSGGYGPANIIELYMNLIPMLLYVKEYVYINQFGVRPQYIVTNYKMSNILRSMNLFFIEAFPYQNILTSSAITDNIIYLVYKPTSDNLMKTGLVALIYNPFYLIKEITDSVQKIFVKSRTLITYGTPLACAKITVLNIPDGLHL